MKKLTIDLGTRSYPILMAENLLEREEITSFLNPSQRLVVTNDTIYDYHKETILKLVDQDASRVLILPDGERYKSAESLNTILTELLTLEFNRNSQLIAFGGGVIGDLVGFAASIYQRGIDFIQVPTTLLAQVDSSVGGKTAINHPLGKNMIGSFYQPSAVLMDLSLLKTLPKREYLSGLAEVLKYGFILSDEFLIWLEANREKILALDFEVVSEMIYRACSFKRDVVNQDETEQGVRALLNLGHTFGHAIERNMKYQGVLHGEAVSIGTVMAGKLSELAGFISHADFARLESLLDEFGLPIRQETAIEMDAMMSAMRLDKKNRDKKIRFVLLKSMGSAEVVDAIEEGLILAAIKYGMV